MRITFLIYFVSILIINCIAQQDARFSLFNYNYLTTNPAMAGVKDRLNTVFLHREQWVGSNQNRPKTTTINLDMPIHQLSSGVGINLSKDQHGIVEEYTSGLNYAVIIGVSEYGTLSLGLTANLHQNRINYSHINTDPGNQNIRVDDNFNFGNDLNAYAFSMGSGIYYYDRFFKFGFSAPIISPYRYYALENSGAKTQYYITTMGLNFRLSQTINYNPRLLVKTASQSPYQIELLNQIIFNDKLATGVSFRSAESISVFGGYTFKKQFSFAYCYDVVVLNELRTTQKGSHEFVLSMLFNFPRDMKRDEHIGRQKRIECADFTPRKKRKFIKEVEDLIYDRN